MRMLTIKQFFFVIALLWSSCVTAQPISTTAGSVTSCPGEILVPVNVADCNGVGAISLMLNYNSAHLTYLGYTDLNPALTAGLLVINSTGNKVIISWVNTTAAFIGTSTLVSFRFGVTTGNSVLTWDTQTPGNCEYSNLSGTILPATFTGGTVTTYYLPVITGNPVDKTILVSQNTSFSVTASGTGLLYQWQVSADGLQGWTDLVNGGIYSNVNGATLLLNNVPLSLNGYFYRCRVSGTCPPVHFSGAATLTVINPVTTSLPSITGCPGGVIVPVTVTNFNGIESFSLTFTFNASSLTYNGYQSVNQALSGGTFVVNQSMNKVYFTWASTTPVSFGDGTLVELLFSSVPGAGALAWDLSIPGNCEYAGANGVPVTAVWINGNNVTHTLPAVVNSPVNKTIATGQNTTFSALGSGSGITYHWQVSTDGGSTFSDLSNGGNYSNVTGQTLNIISASLAMSGYRFRCRISGLCPPQVFTGDALLTVLPNIVTTCGTAIACPGQVTIPVTVSDFIGVASFSLVLSFNSSVLTYTGYQNLNASLASGTFIANAAGNKIYLTWYNTTAATIPSGGTLLEFNFTGVSGSSLLAWDTQTYGNCEYADINGLIIFSTWNGGSATINQPPAITLHPSDKSVYSGGNTSFTAGTTGTSLLYAWQVSVNGGGTWIPLTNGSPYSGVSTPTLNVNPASVTMNGYLYRCSVSGSCPPAVVSNHAFLRVTPAPITTSLPNISNSCTANLDIPVNVTNCTDIGAISLVLQFDTTKLIFDSYHDLHSELSGGILVVNRSGNRIFMSWASITPANIGSGTLLKYRFIAQPSVSANFNWVTQSPGYCEYTGSSGEVITSFFTNATVSVIANPLLANAGQDAGTPYSVPVQLNGSASGGSPPYSYFWTPSTFLNNHTVANPIATPTITTDYTFTVTGANGCVASDPLSVVITVPAIRDIQNVDIPGGDTVCYDAVQVITLAGNGTFFMVQNQGAVTLIAGQRITCLPGTRVFSGGYLHGSITTMHEYCAFEFPPAAPVQGLTGMNDAPDVNLTGNNLCRLFPNPATDMVTLTIAGNESSRTRITIFGISGQKVKVLEMVHDGQQEISLEGISPGLYFVHVQTGYANEVIKLIITD